MPPPILATKLFVPPPRPKVVPRPRLIERLNEGSKDSPGVILISAPAGFGKTTLISTWAAIGLSLEPLRRVAWLSLEETDNDRAQFLTYLVAALQTIAPEFGTTLLGAIQSPQPPPTAAVLTPLLNEIASFPEPIVLVLDDYHVIHDKLVDEALRFLVEHLPPRLRLVITTREDPPLPLARLRARGQLTELRAADLRFTASEAAEFLNQMMGLSLSVEDIAALENRTEGWIAGLQLAALSMQGRADIVGFVQAFTGSHRYIIDYLIEEVLQRQPEEVRSFLLQTSILDRLTESLCEAVTGQADGSGRLRALERANLFVVPLDDLRQWYRYHHLFADVLRTRLREQAEQLPVLHQRASAWYARNELHSEAVQHALAAEDFERAANLMELAWPAVGRSRQDATLRSWLRALPDELIRRRPVLSAYFATAQLLGSELEEVERRLRDAERWLEPAAEAQERPDPLAGERVVANEEEFRRLAVTIAIKRAGLAQARGDFAGAMHYAQQAFDRVQPGDHLGRAGAAGFLGLALWGNGDLAAAQQTFAEAVTSMHLAGHVADALGGTIALAEMQIGRGGLREARRILEQAGQQTAGQGAPALTGTADLMVLMSELDLEQNDVEAAAAHLQGSWALGERASLMENRYRWPLAMARLLAARGSLDSALDRLDEAERLYVSGFFPEARPIGAWRARFWIAQGRLAEAQAWASERGLSAADDPSYLREFEHLTLARLLIAQYRTRQEESTIQEASGLLERLLPAAQAGGRTGSVTEILALQALAHAAQGHTDPALAALERALAQAEPEGYVRLFVDEGPLLAALLKAATKEKLAPNYVPRLLAAFGEAAPMAAGKGRTPAAQPLPDPLSERELEVLRLLRTEMSGPEIARQLMVSLNTFHTHTKNIYSKLGVKNRQMAVIRAAELNLS